MNRDWLGIGGALVAGIAIGYGVAYTTVEKKLRKEYEDAADSRRRAYELALKMANNDVKEEGEILEGGNIERIDITSIELDEVPLVWDNPTSVFDLGNGIVTYDPSVSKEFAPAEDNPYHVASQAEETTVEAFVAGEINQYGISYIEEEEFHDEDGRAKSVVSVLMTEGEPVFLLNGNVIDDWIERLGESILVDFYRFTQPGASEVLYVRNHKTDEDYEVIKDQP